MKVTRGATAKIALSAAFLGGLLFAVPMAAQAASLPATGDVAQARGSSPSVILTAVQTPTLARYTVASGDTLWGIGIRTHRTWPALASYNHIPNPDLIYVGNVLTIPPATYIGSVSLPAPAPTYTPPVRQRYSAPVRTYTPPAPRPVVSTYSGGGGGGGAFTGVWACIAQHESGGNPAENTGNGYYGGLQFTAQTWAAYGGSGSAANASASQQEAVANRIVAAQGGYGAWPNTSRMCGV